MTEAPGHRSSRWGRSRRSRRRPASGPSAARCYAALLRGERSPAGPGAALRGDGVSLRLAGQTHDYGKLRRHRRVRLQADLRRGRAARPRAAAGARRCAPGPGGSVGFLFSSERGGEGSGDCAGPAAAGGGSPGGAAPSVRPSGRGRFPAPLPFLPRDAGAQERSAGPLPAVTTFFGKRNPRARIVREEPPRARWRRRGKGPGLDLVAPRPPSPGRDRAGSSKVLAGPEQGSAGALAVKSFSRSVPGIKNIPVCSADFVYVCTGEHRVLRCDGSWGPCVQTRAYISECFHFTLFCSTGA